MESAGDRVRVYLLFGDDFVPDVLVSVVDAAPLQVPT